MKICILGGEGKRHFYLASLYEEGLGCNIFVASMKMPRNTILTEDSLERVLNLLGNCSEKEANVWLL